MCRSTSKPKTPQSEITAAVLLLRYRTLYPRNPYPAYNRYADIARGLKLKYKRVVNICNKVFKPKTSKLT